jgi:hypothetical protein
MDGRYQYLEKLRDALRQDRKSHPETPISSLLLGVNPVV